MELGEEKREREMKGCEVENGREKENDNVWVWMET